MPISIEEKERKANILKIRADNSSALGYRDI